MSKHEITREDAVCVAHNAASEWARTNATCGCDPEAFGRGVAQVFCAALNPDASSTPPSAEVEERPEQ